ncbi:MAG: hypothetical protein NWT04_01675 [Verrucomicrobiales bacterium]|nr:hypothetical protein [Verrucomicrobiales bacterium]
MIVPEPRAAVASCILIFPPRPLPDPAFFDIVFPQAARQIRSSKEPIVMKRFLLSSACLFIGTLASTQEGPEISADEFPRAAATEPADALATFEVAPGVTLSLAAHEPAVADPIAMSFDEKGRAYVVEMIGYSERREDAVCQVRLLTDADSDGIVCER